MGPDIQSRTTIETNPHRSYTLRIDSGRVIHSNARGLRSLLPEHHHHQYLNNSIFDNNKLRLYICDVPALMLAPILSPPACAPGHKVT